ncbi:MAG: hypothetical protein ABIK10_04345 [candidate division WOR-3 bacterium]
MILGVLNANAQIIQIFTQEGIYYQVLQELPTYYLSPIIINRKLSVPELINLRKLLNNGGAILIDAKNIGQISLDKFKRRRISHLINDRSEAFNNILGVELELPGFVTKNQILAVEYANGYLAVLPFDLNQAIADYRAKRKPFLTNIGKRYPNEIVATISKGALRQLIINLVRWLYKKLNYPYVHLWYYPHNHQSIFGFRVDTDFGSHVTIEKTFELEEKTNVKFTYFVHTQYLFDLPRETKDFQIHCDRHQVYKDYLRNYNNIATAKKILESLGLSPIGFAAPYGFWNINLQRALEANCIKYSSEFSLAYDDLPFFPIVNGEPSTVLQIPIHPICIGRLLHAGVAPKNCVEYYFKYFTTQLVKREPMIIYDHPHRIAEFFEIFGEILNRAQNLPNVWLTTLTNYYYWWVDRLRVLENSSWQIDGDMLKVYTTNVDPSFTLHIVLPNDTEAFIPLRSGVYNLNELKKTKIKYLNFTDRDIEEYKKLHSLKTKSLLILFSSANKILKIITGRKK